MLHKIMVYIFVEGSSDSETISKGNGLGELVPAGNYLAVSM